MQDETTIPHAELARRPPDADAGHASTPPREQT